MSAAGAPPVMPYKGDGEMVQAQGKSPDQEALPDTAGTTEDVSPAPRGGWFYLRQPDDEPWSE